jgi:surface antigen
MKSKKFKILFIFLFLSSTAYYFSTRIDFNTSRTIGEVVDRYNGVDVYYNGGVNQTLGRNRAMDGYNIGIRYQCVEFVKRYYFEHLSHKMPDTYGHAKDFFENSLTDGQYNKRRGLIQYRNSSFIKPQKDDIVVFSAWLFNPYGHVAIISKVENGEVEVIQQNPSPFGQSREVFKLSYVKDRWKIEHSRLLGWLRMKK